jgi:drug/metabolite transporter (DMT)-like permease
MRRPASSSKNASSKILIGTVLVLLSAIGLATQNVISRVFFVSSSLFGYVDLGGWLSPQLSNIVMLLALRMALMAVLLTTAAPLLYRNTFAAIRQLFREGKQLGAVVGSGLCLFVGLTSLYFALSQVAAGIAIAVFFIYPAITVLLAWRFLQQRPHAYQLSLMLVIFFGVVLTTSGPATSASPTLGIVGGLLAGLSFGIYGIFAEIALQPSNADQEVRAALHPVPFSLATFIIVSALTSLSLLFMAPVEVSATSWQPILWATLFSAFITVISYVLNNFGIRLIGASLTALISASAPALTALFAWLTLQEALQLQQIMGVGLVTIGVAALSLKAKQQR